MRLTKLNKLSGEIERLGLPQQLYKKLYEYENIGSVEDVAKNKNLVDRFIENEMFMAKIDSKERERFKDSLVFNSQTLTELGMSLFSKQAEIEDLKRKLKTYENAEEQGLLVRLPCKAGDVLYCIPTFENSMQRIEARPVSYILISDEISIATTIQNPKAKGYIEKQYDVCLGMIGYTVFLTEAEALQALKERENQ